MPEGDTLHRIARTLAPALVGKKVERADARKDALARSIEGKTIESVEAIGKNLLIRFDDGRALRTHLKMNGSWHLYASGQRWRKAASRAVVAIDVGATIAVCFDAPVVEIVRAGYVHPAIEALGPDLLAPDFDEAEAIRRLQALADTPIGEAILDQRAVAGIGNIYKSETLFVARANPFAKVALFDALRLTQILRKARALMTKNVGKTARYRTTRFAAGSRYYVYMRSGKPCVSCGEIIRMQRQALRSTYFCPRCQKV